MVSRRGPPSESRFAHSRCIVSCHSARIGAGVLWATGRWRYTLISDRPIISARVSASHLSRSRRRATTRLYQRCAPAALRRCVGAPGLSSGSLPAAARARRSAHGTDLDGEPKVEPDPVGGDRRKTQDGGYRQASSVAEREACLAGGSAQPGCRLGDCRREGQHLESQGPELLPEPFDLCLPVEGLLRDLGPVHARDHRGVLPVEVPGTSSPLSLEMARAMESFPPSRRLTRPRT
jgi:hypothetical protein